MALKRRSRSSEKVQEEPKRVLELQIHSFAKVFALQRLLRRAPRCPSIRQKAFSSGSLRNKKAQKGTKELTGGTQEVLKEPQEGTRGTQEGSRASQEGPMMPF